MVLWETVYRIRTDKQCYINHQTKNLTSSNTKPTKNGGDFMCSERVRSSCSTRAMVFNNDILPFKQIFSFLRGIFVPAIVLSMFMLALHSVIVCGMLEWKRICVVYCLSFVYITVGYPSTKRGGLKLCWSESESV